MKHNLQIIGDSLVGLENPLYRCDIHVDNIIQGINPLAFCDNSDETMIYEPDDTDSPNVLLSIRKNFDRMLSHDEDNFNSNVIVQPKTERVRLRNFSDYILVYNNLFNYTMFRRDGFLYSNIKCKLCDELSKEHCERISFPYPEDFDWKTNYNRFIDTILAEYRSDQIILLKSSVGPYVITNNVDIHKGTCWDEYAAFAYEVDELFATRTNCICIDDFEASVVNTIVKNPTPFSIRSSDVLEKLVDKLCKIMDGGFSCDSVNDISRNAVFRKKYFPNIITHLRDQYLYAFENESSDSYENEKEDIVALNDFFKDCNCHSITEVYSFMVVSDEILLPVIESYLKYFRCDINDLLTIYKLYEKNRDTYDFTAIVGNILNSSDSVPVRAACELYNKNIKKLNEYKYIHPQLTGGIKDKSHLYIPLNNEYYLVISDNIEEMFSCREIKTDKAFLFSECQNNDFSIPSSSVNSVISDLKFYIERAKSGYGNHPIKVIFNDNDNFEESLWTSDWNDILSNEPFVLVPKSTDIPTDDFKPVCDLSFLFAGNVRLFILRAGLADQMCYYLWSKYVEQRSRIPFDSYYDDISIKMVKSMCPLGLSNVVVEDIESKLLSNKLSRRLNIKCRNTAARFSDALVINGCNEVNTIGTQDVCVKGARNLIMYSEGDYKRACNPRSQIPYYHMVVRPDLLRAKLERHIRIQTLDTKNEDLIKEMTSVDSIVVHIRRGDFITFGIGADMDFYKESMEKLAAIPDYHNKKFYVFSDDIPWCQTHTDEIGFDTYFPDADITYVTHNRQDDDYKDMLLMSFGKVIIGSNSGFVRMAAWMSKTCEVFMCYNLDTMKAFEKNVRKNKYRIGKYKKNYSTNWEGERSSVKKKKK